MGFQKSAIFLLCTGIVSFFLGRLLPKKWFDPTRLPFQALPFEKDGAFYDRFGIRFWHKKAPDMSRILPRFIPKKALEKGFSRNLPRMLQETCVAEVTHFFLIFAGLGILRYMPSVFGVLLWLFYTVINLGFIMIQRYNRPRLMHLSERIEAYPSKKRRISAKTSTKQNA